jgi:hypothetical protein
MKVVTVDTQRHGASQKVESAHFNDENDQSCETPIVDWPDPRSANVWRSPIANADERGRT